MNAFNTLAGTLALVAACSAPAFADETSEWLVDFEEAKKMAKEQDKFILADFTGSDWCGWCIKLKQEVFDTDAFKAWAGENVVLLELDFPRKKQLAASLKEQNDALQKKFGVRGFPTIIFMDPEGNAIGRSGYMRGGPSAWTGNADEVLEKGRAFLKLKAKADKTPAEEAELLLAEIDMGGVDFAKAKERRDGIEGAPEDVLAKLDAKLINLEVNHHVEQASPRSREDMAKPGAHFAEMFAAGRLPTDGQAQEMFYVGLLEHAYKLKDATLFAGGLEKLNELFSSNERAKGFLDMQAQRLKELESAGESK